MNNRHWSDLNPQRCRADSVGGFTLLELVATMLVIGVLAAFAAPRISLIGGYQERFLFDEAVTALRYARQRAVDGQCPYGVLFGDKSVGRTAVSPGGFMVVGGDKSCLRIGINRLFLPIPHPSSGESEFNLRTPLERPYALANPTGVVVPEDAVGFDPFGRPFSGNGQEINTTDVGITFGSRSVTVKAYTGLIVVN